MNSRWEKLINRLIHCTALAVIALGAVAANAVEPQIDPDWQRFQVGISYVDPDSRTIVANDREFELPFNTGIVNSRGQAIAVANLRAGDQVWLYLDSAPQSMGAIGGMPQAKRLERIE